MKRNLLPALIFVFAISGFALIFCQKKEDDVESRPAAAKVKTASTGRLGQGTAPDTQETKVTKDRKKLPAPGAALTPEQEAAEADRQVQIGIARASFQKAVADNDEAAVASRDFLAANARREGVVTTVSGLQYEVVQGGTGPMPVATDKVNVHYHGTLPDGTVFDSSVERREPISFALTQVIAGWTEGLQLMPAGSTFKLTIPSYLAYGERGAPPKIAAHAALIFEVQLLAIEQD